MKACRRLSTLCQGRLSRPNATYHGARRSLTKLRACSSRTYFRPAKLQSIEYYKNLTLLEGDQDREVTGTQGNLAGNLEEFANIDQTAEKVDKNDNTTENVSEAFEEDFQSTLESWGLIKDHVEELKTSTFAIDHGGSVFVLDADDRIAFFQHLRSLLLHDKVSASTVWEFIRTSNWWRSAIIYRLQTPEVRKFLGNREESSLLREALNVILLEMIKKGPSSNDGDWTELLEIMNEFDERCVLDEEQWASCLLLLSKAAFEMIQMLENLLLVGRLWKIIDLSSLLSCLHQVWRSFFYRHQTVQLSHVPSKQVSKHGSNADSVGLWLRENPARFLTKSNPFEERLLAFAPTWKLNSCNTASLQLVCASLMTLVASMRFLSYVRSGPSSITAIQERNLGETWTADLKRASHSELSFMFPMAQAALGTGTNLITLQLSLARLNLSPSQAEYLTTALEALKYHADTILRLIEAHHKNASNNWIDDTRAREKHRAKVLLLHAIEVVKTPADLEEVHRVCDCFVSLYPRLDPRSLYIELCEKYWELKCPEKALKLWHEHPLVQFSSHLTTRTFSYYCDGDDLKAFNEAWRLTATNVGRFSEELWQMHLKFLFRHNHTLEAEAAFFEAVRDTRSSKEVSSISHDIGQILSPKTWNLMIEQLLKVGQTDRANAFRLTMEKDLFVQPNQETYYHLIDHHLKKADLHSADTIAGAMSSRGLGNASLKQTIDYLIISLEIWPCSAFYVEKSIIVKAIEKSLRFLFRSPLVPTRRHVDLEESNSLLFIEIARAIDTRISGPRRIRLLMFLQEEYSRKLGPNSTEMDRFMTNFLESISREEQLLLLNGDLFDPNAERGNFSFVSKWFATWFISKELHDVIPSSIVGQVKSIKWRGLARLGHQSLLDAGIIHQSARGAILRVVKALERETSEARQDVLARAGIQISEPNSKTSEQTKKAKMPRKPYKNTTRMRSITLGANLSPDIEAIKALRRRLTAERQSLLTKYGLADPKKIDRNADLKQKLANLQTERESLLAKYGLGDSKRIKGKRA